VVYTAGQQLLWGFLGVASVAFAVVFDGRHQPDACGLAEGAAGVCGGLFVLSLLRGRRLLRKRR
jgi:hypothetical protein